MARARSRRGSHLLSLAMSLAAASLAWGCAAEGTKPKVAQEQSAAATVDQAKPAAQAPATNQPISAGAPDFWQNLPRMSAYHGYENGLRWRLRAAGIELESAKIEGHKVDPRVIEKVWGDYGPIMKKWSAHYEVPIELIVTTVSVESRGNPKAKGGKNVGLMQLLVPTARGALGDPSITEQSLYDPETNIRAGTAYIAGQRKKTLYDPPKVAAAYNAGSLRSASNRWGMKQYGPHLDKTVLWFNATLAFMAKQDQVPDMSFAGYFKSNP